MHPAAPSCHAARLGDSLRHLALLVACAGFADWLRLQLARVGQGLLPSVPLLLPGEAEQLEEVAAGHLPGLGWTQHGEHQGATAAETGKGGSSTGASSSSEQQKQQQQQAEQERAAVVLGWALADDAWLHSSRLEAAVEPVLMRLAAHYLLLERRRCAAEARARLRCKSCWWHHSRFARPHASLLPPVRLPAWLPTGAWRWTQWPTSICATAQR